MNNMASSLTQPSNSPKDREIRGNLGLNTKHTLTNSAANVMQLKKNL